VRLSKKICNGARMGKGRLPLTILGNTIKRSLMPTKFNELQPAEPAFAKRLTKLTLHDEP
jgi:hypothetical protein